MSETRPSASASWQKNVICRYFVVGSCQKGSDCSYSHDPELAAAQSSYSQMNEFCEPYYTSSYADQSDEYTGEVVYGCEYVPECPPELEEEEESQHEPQHLYHNNNHEPQQQQHQAVLHPHLQQNSPSSCYHTTACQIQSLSVGMNTMSLDPCSDPNCLDNSQSVLETQEFSGGCSYNSTGSPTYIVYAPVYQSPPAPGVPTLVSPVGAEVVSPGPGASPISISVSPQGSNGILSPAAGILSPTGVLSPVGGILSPGSLISPVGGLMSPGMIPTSPGLQHPSMISLHMQEQSHDHTESHHDATLLNDPTQSPHDPIMLYDGTVGHIDEESTVGHQYNDEGGAQCSLEQLDEGEIRTSFVYGSQGSGVLQTPVYSVTPPADVRETTVYSGTPPAPAASNHNSCLTTSTSTSPLNNCNKPVINKGFSVSKQSGLNPNTAEFSPSPRTVVSCAPATQQQQQQQQQDHNSQDRDETCTSQYTAGAEGGGWRAPTNWALAPEFKPSSLAQNSQHQEQPSVVNKQRSWAQVVNSNIVKQGNNLSVADAESQLCPYYRVGECRYGDICMYIHGNSCDYCGQNVLHPNHENQRKAHLGECLREHERDMELSFAVARSREKTCGICMEVVLDKSKGEARFGILPSCNHCFCLPCIRKWRQAKQFEHKIIRACPECRQTSDFICPSRFWVETPEQKEQLLSEYKKNLGLKECKYFNKGSGECPFGNKCFYQHADKDGRIIDVGPPRKPQRRVNAEGNLSLVQRLLLYDFLEEREGQLVLPMEFVELFDLYSDSDDWTHDTEIIIHYQT